MYSTRPVRGPKLALKFEHCCAVAELAVLLVLDILTVCIRSHYVALAHEDLVDTDVGVCSVICFPEGTQSGKEKAGEGRRAAGAGAQELDFVINWSLLKQGSYESIFQDLRTIRTFVPKAVPIKLILETSQLDRLEIVAGCLLASAAGFDFVKTSTGFLGAGAKVEDVRLMRYVVSKEGVGMGVKASGGIRSAADATAMLQAGATRLGLSGSVAIMEEGRGVKEDQPTANDGY